MFSSDLTENQLNPAVQDRETDSESIGQCGGFSRGGVQVYWSCQPAPRQRIKSGSSSKA
jgi:hypothetical protein